jgi:hypothetical protein
MNFLGTILLSAVAGDTDGVAPKVLDRKRGREPQATRHQNWAIFELFSGLSEAEKLDRKRVDTVEVRSSSFLVPTISFNGLARLVPRGSKWLH